MSVTGFNRRRREAEKAKTVLKETKVETKAVFAEANPTTEEVAEAVKPVKRGKAKTE